MKNSMGTIKFFVLHIMSVLLLAWVYHSVFFRNASFLDFKETEEMYYYILFLFIAFGLLFTIDRSRNGISVFINLLLPFECITAILYFSELKYIILLSLVIATVLSVKQMIKLIKRPIKTIDKEKRKKIKFRRFEHWFNYSRSITSIASLLIIISLFVFVYIIPFVAVAFDAQKPVVPSYYNKTEWTIENKYKDLAIFFDEEAWEKSSTRKRAKAIQIVCNIEAVHLEIRHELSLRINNVRNTAYGTYDDEKNRVTICVPHKQSGEEALIAVLHECRHAYQHELIYNYETLTPEEQSSDTYDYVRVIKEELDNYAEISNERYGKMKVENDSQDYSYTRAEEYRSIYENLINEGSKVK